MLEYHLEVAKQESRTPLFYYPYQVKLKSERMKLTVATFFYRFETSNVLRMRSVDVDRLLKEEKNLERLAGKYVYHYYNPRETEQSRISTVKNAAPKALGRRGIDGFFNFLPNVNDYNQPFEEGKDFEVIVGERVDIKQSKKLTFDDLPDLMKVDE